MRLVIGRGGLEDVPDADRLIREAADWLTQAGKTLWGSEETSHDALLQVARAGELVMGRVEDEAVSCMYLHGEDREFWPHTAPGEAFYVHRLAVARAYAGQGVSRLMLGWAEGEAKRCGRAHLRLDCEPRAKLLALYRDAGFVRIDAEPIQVGRHFVVRHEKRVGITARAR
jgi:GNAT superfamily N-acetyltransferase